MQVTSQLQTFSVEQDSLRGSGYGGGAHDCSYYQEQF